MSALPPADLLLSPLAFWCSQAGLLAAVGWLLAAHIRRDRAVSHAASALQMPSETDGCRETELIIEAIHEGICAINTNGQCIRANAAARRLLDVSEAELRGQSMHDRLFHPGAHAPVPDDCPFAQVLGTGSALGMSEAEVPRSDGSVVAVGLAVAPIVDGRTVCGVVVSLFDNSEHVILQRSLERASRLSALGRLATAVAHDFNNVLMAIQPFAEVIRRQTTDEGIRTAAHRILGSIQRGRHIAQEMIHYVRPAQPVRKPFHFGRWVEQLVEELGFIPASVAVDIEVQDDLWLEGDPEQLSELFTNLVMNARDAMPDGGTIRVSAAPCLSGGTFRFGVVHTVDLFAHVIVSDTGLGIPVDALEHVFDPFFTTKRNGTGLGLAIVHQIVQLHDGQVFVESAQGKGTSFHLFLPLAERMLAEPELEPVVGGDAALALGTRRILLVEDDRDVADGLVDALRCEGIECEVVPCGKDVVPSLERVLPDAIVLDIGLPDVPGTEVYAWVRERWPELPVIISTGHADPDSVWPLSFDPNARLLRKPYPVDALLGELASIGEARRPEGA